MGDAPGMLVECAITQRSFRVRSAIDGGIDEATVHCSGESSFDNGWKFTNYSSLRAASRPADVGALYHAFNSGRLQYGPGYRTLTQAWGNESTASSLRARLTHEGTDVHPADLDDALCTSAVIAMPGVDGETRLPFALDD